MSLFNTSLILKSFLLSLTFVSFLSPSLPSLLSPFLFSHSLLSHDLSPLSSFSSPPPYFFPLLSIPLPLLSIPLPLLSIPLPLLSIPLPLLSILLPSSLFLSSPAFMQNHGVGVTNTYHIFLSMSKVSEVIITALSLEPWKLSFV